MGDFSNIKFRKEENFTSVNFQQGKVQLDSDLNEQNYINRYHQKTSLSDVIGKYGTPSENPGFEIIPNDKPLLDLADIPGKGSIILAQFIQNNFGIDLIPIPLASKIRSFEFHNNLNFPYDDDVHYDDEIISMANLIFEKAILPEPRSISLKAQSVDGLHNLEINVIQGDTKSFLYIDGKKVYEFLVDENWDDAPPKIFTRSFRIGSGKYYVNGTLCQNFKEIESLRQPSLPSSYGNNIYLFSWKNVPPGNNNKGDLYNIIRFLENFGIYLLLDSPDKDIYKDISSFFSRTSDSEIKIKSKTGSELATLKLNYDTHQDIYTVSLSFRDLFSSKILTYHNFITEVDEGDENNVKVYYSGIHTPAFPVMFDDELSYFIAYLVVSEKEESSIEAPYILETALKGIETTTRTRTISQVRLMPIGEIVDICDMVFGWPKIESNGDGGFKYVYFKKLIELFLFLERHFYIRINPVVYKKLNENNVTEGVLSENNFLKFYPISDPILGLETLHEFSLSNVYFRIIMDVSKESAYLYINDRLATEFIVKRGKDDDFTLYHVNKSLLEKYWKNFLEQKSKLRNSIQVKLKENIEPDFCDISGNSGEFNTLTKGNYFYRFQVNNPGFAGQATFKYSKNNGYMKAQVLGIERKDSSESLIRIGRSNFGNIKPENLNWVEILDDRRELHGIPGSFVQLRKGENDFTFVFNHDEIYGDPIDSENYPLEFNPKIILWNNDGNMLKIDPSSNTVLISEDSIEVKPMDSSYYYSVSEFWNFATRDGKLEPPVRNEELGSGDTSKILLSSGSDHDFAPLALLKYIGEEKKFHLLKDLRVFLQSQVESKITTGLITLLVKPMVIFPRIPTTGPTWIMPSVYGPFRHYFNDALKPLSIVLSLEQIFSFQDNLHGDYLSLEDFQNVSSSVIMEDHSLMRGMFADPIIDLSKIKAFGINNDTFMIKFENNEIDKRLRNANSDTRDKLGYLVKIRWTAINGIEKNPQTNVTKPELEYNIQFGQTFTMDYTSNPVIYLDIASGMPLINIHIKLDYAILNLYSPETTHNVSVNVDFYLPNGSLFSSEELILYQRDYEYNGYFNITEDQDTGNVYAAGFKGDRLVDLKNFIKNDSIIVVKYLYFDYTATRKKEIRKSLIIKNQ